MLRQILPGLIGGLIAVVLGIIAVRTQRGAVRTREGWRRMRPGFMMHLGFFGSLAFVLIVAFFFASGGSARRDADDQNFYALLLGVAFFAGAFWCLWQGYLRTVEWSGSVIRVRAPFIGEQKLRFADIVDITDNIDGSQSKLHASDGRVVRVNVHSHGYKELIEAIDRYFDQPTRPEVRP